MAGAERLPFEREQPVTLKVAERAVVGEHVETIARPLESAAGLVPAVDAGSRVGADQRRPIVGGQAPGNRHQLVVGKIRCGIQRRGDHFRFAVGIEISECDFRPRLGLDVGDDRLCQAVERVPGLREIFDPSAAAVRLIHPCEERGNHLPQLGEHQLGVAAHFLQRMREHAQQQRFERLARSEQADVGSRRSRQQAAKRVERLGANHRPIDGVGVFRRLGMLRAEMLLHRGDPAGVCFEGAVEGADERLAKRRAVDSAGT